MKCEFCNKKIDDDHGFECAPFIKKSFNDWMSLEGVCLTENVEIDNQVTEGEKNENLDFELKELNKMSEHDRICMWITERHKETGRKFVIHTLVYKVEEIFD